jgi:hypothetical protein
MGPKGNQRQKLIYKLKIRIKTQNLYLRPLLPLLLTNQGQKLSLPCGHGTKGRCGQKYKSKGQKNDVLINKQYFYLDDEVLEVKNKVKIYIPLKPVISNNEEVKRIFIEGIKKSLYFIN